MNSVIVRIPEETAESLARVAERLSQPAESVAMDAIEDFLAREEWQVAEIEAAVAEADRGDFATDEEVKAVLGGFSAGS
ncbi:hypothetical protein AAIH46_02035 [Rhizobium sp. 0TCS1.26]|uniref:CopG family ribbon-helix-helix protein n=1 Tax=Rhizobium sp. 0TCS1.26 TaxID=3142623 RepID=UPI003D2C8BF4